MRKVNYVAEVLIFTKFQFSHLFLEEKWRDITPALHPDLPEGFCGFPKWLHIQCCLCENQAPGALKAGAGGCFRALNGPRESIFWVRTHFAFHLQKSTVLATTLIFWQVKDHFWAVLRPLLSSQSLIFTHPAFEVQPLREASKHF